MTSSAAVRPTHQSSAPNSTQIRETHLKVMYLGIALSLGVPALLLLLGYFLRASGSLGGTVAEPNRMLFYALLIVACSELPAALIMKKTLLKPLTDLQAGSASIPTTDYVFSRYLVLFSLAAACPVYGLVWYLMGGTMPEFALFAVLGLIIFRLSRPSTDFFFSLFVASFACFTCLRAERDDFILSVRSSQAKEENPELGGNSSISLFYTATN